MTSCSPGCKKSTPLKSYDSHKFNQHRPSFSFTLQFKTEMVSKLSKKVKHSHDYLAYMWVLLWFPFQSYFWFSSRLHLVIGTALMRSPICYSSPPWLAQPWNCYIPFQLYPTQFPPQIGNSHVLLQLGSGKVPPLTSLNVFLVFISLPLLGLFLCPIGPPFESVRVPLAWIWYNFSLGSGTVPTPWIW